MFKSEKEIHDFIKNQGLFVNDNEISIKTSDSEFEKLTNICIGDEVIKATDRLNEFFRYNSYPFIDLNNITIPEINIGIINKYHRRSAKIEEHNKLKEQVKDAKDILNKKYFRLVKFESVKPNEEHYQIFNLNTSSLSAYDNSLLTSSEMKKAVKFPNKLFFQRAISDDGVNQYAEQYDVENKKFNELKINEYYGSRK